MRPEFYAVYDGLYADYAYTERYSRRDFYEFDLIRIIQRIIDSETDHNKIRPDAKFFLLVNFHQLVLKPLFEARRYSKDPYFETGLVQDIEDDINAIISYTFKEFIENEEISGHEIMKTIDALWTQLKTTRIEIWG
jgi:hypothetical protein